MAFFTRRAAAYAIVAACAAAPIVAVERPSSSIDAVTNQPQQPAPDATDQQQAKAVCGTCHPLPPPDILPRQAWRDEFIRMMFIRENRLPPIGPPGVVNRTIQLPRVLDQVLPFFTIHGRDRLPAREACPDPSESPVRFTRHSLTMPDMPNTPAVSNVNLVHFTNDKQVDVLGTDMRQGLVFVGQPGRSDGTLSIVASIPHPAHVVLTDVDHDGLQDLLVADLGQFLPADHHDGAVIWLRGLGKGKFGAFWLDGWPRVADVEAADFNGDGKADLAVAAFGWRKTGQIAILENTTVNPSQPAFTNHTIDPRTGGIHIIPVDLNHDGKMDFVTVLAQEHETVLAYINKGTGDFSFEQKVIYAAPHPNWGSSGIQLVDLDKDGDLDVILTHGDTFDDGIVKPYHGIQWLENTGTYPFVEHTLAQVPGVSRAIAADVDGDGDLDIVACALLASGSDVDENTLPALVWLEQTKPGVFVRHTIEKGTPRHATLDVGDIDGDGHLDIVVGNFSIEKPMTSWVDVWSQVPRPSSRVP
jgi:hypothetical protein